MSYKKLLLIVISMIISIGLFSVKSNISLDFDRTRTDLLENNSDYITINYEISQINYFDVKTKEGNFTQIGIPTFAYTNQTGLPKLPLKRKIISVPLDAEVIVSNVDYDEKIISLEKHQISNPIIPDQPSIPKSADPSTIPFKYNRNAYQTNSYTDSPLVNVKELGIMRGVRLFAVDFRPVQYNPGLKTVKVFNNVQARIDFVNGDHLSTESLRKKTYSPAFESVYARTIFNYTPQRDVLEQSPIKYVIISDEMFESHLQPFVEWKKLQGYQVVEAYTNEIGNSTSQIKSYIEDLYNEADENNPAPSYILFVGDVDQVPAYNGGTGGHVTDLDYVLMEGNDLFPEIYYGRFSANNVSELLPQIDKTIEFEKYEMPDPSYLGETVLIAGMDSSFGSTHGNGQINYGTQNYFNQAHGITSHTYLYPESGSSSNQIINDVSEGAGYVNYTAHGSSTSWADPSFTISDINNLGNESQYPLVVGNCCLTNKFEVGECFGEAWLRAENQGAVGYIGGTNSTYWDEDYWWGVGNGPVDGNGPSYEETGIGVYDGLFHDHGEAYENWFTSSAQIIYCGNMAVVEGNGSYDYYWEIYSIMGDPSLKPYLGEPETNVVDYDEEIMIGMDNVTVQAEPYSYVGITSDGEYIAAGLVDDSGEINLNLGDISEPQLLDVTITAQNKIPHFGEIEIIPAAGPYVTSELISIVDDDNQQADYNETFSLEMSFTNVGVETSGDLTATIASEDPYLIIEENTVALDALEPNETVTPEDMFEVTLTEDVPDFHNVSVNIVIEDDSNTWESDFSFLAHAPILDFVDFSISDPTGNNNGRLDPGETADILINVENSGSSEAYNLIGEISSTDAYITINDTDYEYGNIDHEEMLSGEFSVTVSADAPTGHTALFDFIGAADYNIVFESEFSTTIGQIPVLIVELDPQPSSGSALQTILDDNNIAYVSENSIPDSLELYSSIFVFLGIYSDNYELSSNEGSVLAEYLNNGGSLYMEGGDTWYFDDQTAVHDMFGISSNDDGSGDLSTINGVTDTFTENMSFSYSGENNWIDHLSASGTNAQVIFENSSPSYGCAVSNDTVDYKTI